MSHDRGRYFEDFKPGDRFQSAPLPISEALIVEFGRFYDPQVFHTDPQAARETIYGGLIASGLQTIALTFKLFPAKGSCHGLRAAVRTSCICMPFTRWRKE